MNVDNLLLDNEIIVMRETPKKAGVLITFFSSFIGVILLFSIIVACIIIHNSSSFNDMIKQLPTINHPVRIAGAIIIIAFINALYSCLRLLNTTYVITNQRCLTIIDFLGNTKNNLIYQNIINVQINSGYMSQILGLANVRLMYQGQSQQNNFLKLDWLGRQNAEEIFKLVTKYCK